VNEVVISPDVLGLPQAIVQAFEGAQDAGAETIGAAWRTQIVHWDVIDTRTYLNAIKVEDAVYSGGVRTVLIDAPEAGSYASAIKRRDDDDYVGQRVAEEAIELSDKAINAELDKAGNSLK
jgi:hypothetical protein